MTAAPCLEVDLEHRLAAEIEQLRTACEGVAKHCDSRARDLRAKADELAGSKQYGRAAGLTAKADGYELAAKQLRTTLQQIPRTE